MESTQYVDLFTYWALAVHGAKLFFPKTIPSTIPLALFVAIAGEGVNVWVKQRVNRTKDLLTHWVPLLFVAYTQQNECCFQTKDLYLLLFLMLAYFVYHGQDAHTVWAIYEK